MSATLALASNALASMRSTIMRLAAVSMLSGIGCSLVADLLAFLAFEHSWPGDDICLGHEDVIHAPMCPMLYCMRKHG